MNTDEPPNAVTSLVEGIRYLSAVRAQLTDEADPELRNEARYGALVPPLPLDHLSLFEAARVDDEMLTENWSLAYELMLAIDALRELLRRHERSRAAEPRLLHWSIGAPYMNLMTR